MNCFILFFLNLSDAVVFYKQQKVII